MFNFKESGNVYLLKAEVASRNVVPENIKTQFRNEMKDLVDEVHKDDGEHLLKESTLILDSLGEKFSHIDQQEKYSSFIREFLESRLKGVSKETFKEESDLALEKLKSLLPTDSKEESSKKETKSAEAVAKEMDTALDSFKNIGSEKSTDSFPVSYDSPDSVKQGLILYNEKSSALQQDGQKLSLGLSVMMEAIAQYNEAKESRSLGSKLKFWKKDPASEKLNKDLSEFRKKYQASRKEVDKRKAELESAAPLLNEAPEEARKAFLADRSLENQSEGNKSRIKLLKENRALILKRKEGLIKQRKNITDREGEIEKSEEVALKSIDSLKEAKSSLEKALLASPNHPRFLQKLKVIESQIERLTNAQGVMKTSEEGLLSTLDTNDGHMKASDLFTKGLDDSIAALDYSGQVIAQQIELKELTLEGINDLDQIVSETILTQNIAHDTLFQSVDAQWKGLPKDIPDGTWSRLGDAWDSTLGTAWDYSFGQVGSLLKFANKNVFKGLNYVINPVLGYLEDITASVPVISGLTSVVGGIRKGLLTGAETLVDGVGSIIESPMKFAGGLVSLVGVKTSGELGWSLDTLTSTWKSMGAALVSSEKLSSGKLGTISEGIGEAIFNIGTMVLSGGGLTAAKVGISTAKTVSKSMALRAATFVVKKGGPVFLKNVAYHGTRAIVGSTMLVASTGVQMGKNMKTTAVDAVRGTGNLARALITPSKFKRLSMRRVSTLKDIARTWKKLEGVDKIQVKKLLAKSIVSKKKLSMKELSSIGIKTGDQILAFRRLVSKRQKLTQLGKKLKNPKFEQARKIKALKKKMSRRERLAIKSRLGEGLRLTGMIPRTLYRSVLNRLRPKRVKARLKALTKNIEDLFTNNPSLAKFKGKKYSELNVLKKRDLLQAGLKPSDIIAFRRLKRLTKYQNQLSRIKHQMMNKGTVGLKSMTGKEIIFTPTNTIKVGKKTFNFGERVSYKTKGKNQEGFIVGITKEGQAILVSKRPKMNLFESPQKLHSFIDKNGAVIRNKGTKLESASGVTSIPKNTAKVSGKSGKSRLESSFGNRDVTLDLSSAQKLKKGQEVLVHTGDKSYIIRRSRTRPFTEQYKVYEFNKTTGKKGSKLDTLDNYPFTKEGADIAVSFGNDIHKIDTAFSTRGVFKNKELSLFQSAKGRKYREIDMKALKADDVNEIFFSSGENLFHLKNPQGGVWEVFTNNKMIGKVSDVALNNKKLGDSFTAVNNKKIGNSFKVGIHKIKIDAIKCKSPFDKMQWNKVLDMLPKRTSLSVIERQIRIRLKSLVEVGPKRAAFKVERAKMLQKLDDLFNSSYVSRADHVKQLIAVYDDFAALAIKGNGFQYVGSALIGILGQFKKLKTVPAVALRMAQKDSVKIMSLLGVSSKTFNFSTFSKAEIASIGSYKLADRDPLQDLPIFHKEMAYKKPKPSNEIEYEEIIRLVPKATTEVASN